MRQIIILDAKRQRPTDAAVDEIFIRAVFWLPAVAGSEIPSSRPSRVAEASPEENEALRTGAVIEEDFTASYPEDATSAQIRGALVTAYEERAAVLAAPERTRLAQFYGASYEDGVWSRA